MTILNFNALQSFLLHPHKFLVSHIFATGFGGVKRGVRVELLEKMLVRSFLGIYYALETFKWWVH
jgi:hypothetical protein